jgi:hypothetical protein
LVQRCALIQKGLMRCPHMNTGKVVYQLIYSIQICQTYVLDPRCIPAAFPASGRQWRRKGHLGGRRWEVDKCLVSRAAAIHHSVQYTRHHIEPTDESLTHGMGMPSSIAFGGPQRSEMLIDVSSSYMMSQTNRQTHTSLS